MDVKPLVFIVKTLQSIPIFYIMDEDDLQLKSRVALKVMMWKKGVQCDKRSSWIFSGTIKLRNILQ